MIAGITAGSNTTDGSRCSARARINALVAVTGLVCSTVLLNKNSFINYIVVWNFDKTLLLFYGVIDTLSATARHKGIAKISSATEADGSVVSAAIGSWFTVGVNSARVRVTQITC